MGIRMVLLDGLTVADLLALRQGGFFEGAEVRLAEGSAAPTLAPVVLPVQEVVKPVPVPVVSVAPAEDPDPPITLTLEQLALLDAARAELAEYRVEKASSAPVEARSDTQTSIDPVAVAVVAPESFSTSSGGLPSVARLAGCTKLRDVLQLLIEGGMPSSELAGYLESVKAEVPLLQRIQNIADRVARTLEVMGTGA